MEGISARALEFTILTVGRTGDTMGAKWSEIDEKEKLWTVPAERLKGKKGTRKRDKLHSGSTMQTNAPLGERCRLFSRTEICRCVRQVCVGDLVVRSRSSRLRP
jgi:hypothetical protein